MPPELSRGGVPSEFLGEDFAGRIRFDEGMDAEAGAGVAGVWKGAEDDMEAVGGFLDGGFGEAGDLKEAAGYGGVSCGV